VQNRNGWCRGEWKVAVIAGYTIGQYETNMYRKCQSGLEVPSASFSEEKPKRHNLRHSTMPSMLIKKMKIFHACGPYGNDCGYNASSSSGGSHQAKTMSSRLSQTQHYNAELESLANST
jgi:hypothetical protein